jgi:hypothetical protein
MKPRQMPELKKKSVSEGESLRGMKSILNEYLQKFE